MHDAEMDMEICKTNNNCSELYLYKNNIKIKILNHILKDVNS
jgi:hypothetical protein